MSVVVLDHLQPLSESDLEILDGGDTMGWGKVLAELLVAPNRNVSRPFAAIPDEYMEKLALLYLAPPLDCTEARELRGELLERDLVIDELDEFAEELTKFTAA